jgi:hypothetical protein
VSTGRIDGGSQDRVSVAPTQTTPFPQSPRPQPATPAPTPSPGSVVQYAFGDILTHPQAPPPSAPNSTFGDGKPEYNPNIGGNLESKNGQEAANGILRLEKESIVSFSQADEAQLINQSLAAHKNDPSYLREFFNTLGADRASEYVRYQNSIGHVATPSGFSLTSANANDLAKQNQNLATALSTMASAHVFNQSDMDKLVSSFANQRPENNFSFTKDVLSQASPEVQQMFYRSAKDYALANLNTSAGQAMAAYAAQALAFAPSATQATELNALRHQGFGPVGSVDRLPEFIKAAMQGEVRYGNPPSFSEFAKTGIASSQGRLGEPLTGVPTLISNAAHISQGTLDGDVATPGLNSKDAAAIQTELSKTRTDVLQSDPSARDYYAKLDDLQQADSTQQRIQTREEALRATHNPDLQPNDTGVYNAYDAVGTVTANSQTIKDTAAKYNVDPALLAGTVASEMDFDHSTKDYFQDGFGRLGLLFGKGPGIASVHQDTLQWALDYLKANRPEIAAQYPKDPGNPSEFPNSVRDAAVVLSALVAYREDQSKASGIPTTSNSATDMAVIWGAYRTGIQGVTPGGKGFSPAGFLQDQGLDAPLGPFSVGKNAYISQPYFELFQQTLG